MSHDAQASRLLEVFKTLEKWRTDFSTDFRVDEHLNRAVFHLEASLQSFPLPNVLALSEEGHTFEFALGRDDWRLEFRAASGALTIETQHGDWNEVIGDGWEEAEIASREGRAEALYKICGEFECKAVATIVNQPQRSGFHWIHSAGTFLKSRESETWLRFAQAVEQSPRVSRLVFGDGANSVFETRTMICHGPDVWPDAPHYSQDDRLQLYRQSFLADVRMGLCMPERLAAHGTVAGNGVAAELSSWMNQIAHALVWIWLADEADIPALLQKV